jgi:hypothetical protein
MSIWHKSDLLRLVEQMTFIRIFSRTDIQRVEHRTNIQLSGRQTYEIDVCEIKYVTIIEP